MEKILFCKNTKRWRWISCSLSRYPRFHLGHRRGVRYGVGGSGKEAETGIHFFAGQKFFMHANVTFCEGHLFWRRDIKTSCQPRTLVTTIFPVQQFTFQKINFFLLLVFSKSLWRPPKAFCVFRWVFPYFVIYNFYQSEPFAWLCFIAQRKRSFKPYNATQIWELFLPLTV